MRYVRWIVGFLIGYAVVVLTTEFGFRLLPERPIHSGNLLVIALGGLVAVVAGLGGGAAASWIARNRIAGACVLAPLLAETYWLLFLHKQTPPVDWRDAVAALTLLAAVAAGAYFSGPGRRPLRSRPSSSPSRQTTV